MFHKKNFVYILCMLVVLLAACGQVATPVPPTNTPVPTVVPPTSTPLPTAIPLDNPTLTFELGECAYSGPNSLPNGEFTLDLVQSKTDPLLFGYALVTLQNGKTLADLKAWPSTDPPDWLTVWSDQGYLAMTQSLDINLTYHMAYKPSESLYLVCFQQDAKGNINQIGAFGPITVQE